MHFAESWKPTELQENLTQDFNRPFKKIITKISDHLNYEKNIYHHTIDFYIGNLFRTGKKAHHYGYAE